MKEKHFRCPLREIKTEITFSKLKFLFPLLKFAQIHNNIHLPLACN